MTAWHGPRRVTHRPPNTASLRGVDLARQALLAPATGQGPDVLLAERRRLEIEAEQQQRRQCCLPLRQGE